MLEIEMPVVGTRRAVRHAAPDAPPFRDVVAQALVGAHERLVALFTALDGGAEFRRDVWTRPGGGGGDARVLVDGRTFEKAGINRSIVHGALSSAAAARLGVRTPSLDALTFYATGVSMVVHPRSPLVPILHLNVRYFEIADADGTRIDAWFGGGADLTPTYPAPDDARTFHRAVRAACDARCAGTYARFKPQCDEYFVNRHRDGEARGIGGVFFDHVRAGDQGMNADGWLAFLSGIAELPTTAYAPIVRRRAAQAYGERERALQLLRRGRYVEFNLLHDRGTVFGLQTDARVESVLMSLPPIAAWPYAPTFEAESLESALFAMLAPRDWANEPLDDARVADAR